MKKQPDRSGTLHLVLMAGDRADDPIGVAAAPPHLPEPVLRLPGETPNQLYARALATATGQGVVAARVMYRDDLPSPVATRH
jgi:hypothetical protein